MYWRRFTEGNPQSPLWPLSPLPPRLAHVSHKRPGGTRWETLQARGSLWQARGHHRVGGCQLAHGPSWRRQPGSAEVKAGEGPGCSHGLRTPPRRLLTNHKDRGAFTAKTFEDASPTPGTRRSQGGLREEKMRHASC